METLNFSHTGNIGDVWAAIPAMKKCYEDTGKKINLYLEKDIPAVYYEGAVHPTKDSQGNYCMLNQQMINMMIPLLKEQDFINECKVWEDEKIQYYLGWIRDADIGMPGFSINRWYFYVFPDLSCDLSGVWLQVPETDKDLAMGKVLITRSERYTNPAIDYSFLKPYEDDLIFCGTMREYNNFCMAYDLNIKKLTINNFLDLAQAVSQCKFHISNQTQAFQLSEGLKKPRILELCKHAPNVIPIGENAFDFLAQIPLEVYFHKLNGTYEWYRGKLKAEHSPALEKGNDRKINLPK